MGTDYCNWSTGKREKRISWEDFRKGRSEVIRRKRTWRQTNKSLQVGETICKDMDMAKSTMHERKSKESYLIGASYLGGLESSGK